MKVIESKELINWIKNMPLTKDEIAEIVVEVSQTMAWGFRTAAETTDEVAAAAASNTGIFILQALHYNNDEIKGMIEKWKADNQSLLKL